MFFVLIAISVLPVFLLGYYIYIKDSEKEPKSLLMGLFGSGLLAAILVIIINILIILIAPEFYISDGYNRFNFLTLFALVFLEIALVEEFSKWIMIRLIGYKNKEFDQLYDIIVYSVFVALGFAAIENILYVIQGGFSLGIYRALFSVPGHACFGVFMGYFLALAKTNEKKDKFKYRFFMILSILVPALLHTFYNFCLMRETYSYLFIFLGFVIILYVSAVKEVNVMSKKEDSVE